MSHNAEKATSFQAAFTPFCHPPLADPLPTQRNGAAIGEHPTLQSKALRQPVLQASPFSSQSCSPGSRSAPAAGTAPPFHCTWFRFTSPLPLLSSHPPPTQSDCHAPVCPTRKLANRTDKPHQRKSHPVQRSGKRRLNAILSGCRSQSCKSARTSLALQPRQPQPPRSRRSAAVSFHIVPFHFGAVPAFPPCFHQRNRFPRPGFPTRLKNASTAPIHPFQRCEKQPQPHKPKHPMQAVAFRFPSSCSQHPAPRSRSSRSHITSPGCVYDCDYPCFSAQTWQRLAVFHGVVCPVNPQ